MAYPGGRRQPFVIYVPWQYQTRDETLFLLFRPGLRTLPLQQPQDDLGGVQGR